MNPLKLVSKYRGELMAFAIFAILLTHPGIDIGSLLSNNL